MDTESGKKIDVHTSRAAYMQAFQKRADLNIGEHASSQEMSTREQTRSNESLLRTEPHSLDVLNEPKLFPADFTASSNYEAAILAYLSHLEGTPAYGCNGLLDGFGPPKGCNCRHACPRCSAEASVRAARDVEDLLLLVDRERDLRAFYVTLTARHARSDCLREVRERLENARTRLLDGRSGMKFRRAIRLLGHSWACEPAWNDDGGWHPHLNWIVVVDASVTQRQISMALSAGIGVSGDAGFHVEAYREGTAHCLAAYVTKDSFGERAMGDQLSKGLGPLLLHLGSNDEQKRHEAARLLHDYLNETHGQRRFQVARGRLRDRLGVQRSIPSGSGRRRRATGRRREERGTSAVRGTQRCPACATDGGRQNLHEPGDQESCARTKRRNRPSLLRLRKSVQEVIGSIQSTCVPVGVSNCDQGAYCVLTRTSRQGPSQTPPSLTPAGSSTAGWSGRRKMTALSCFVSGLAAKFTASACNHIASRIARRIRSSRRCRASPSEYARASPIKMLTRLSASIANAIRVSRWKRMARGQCRPSSRVGGFTLARLEESRKATKSGSFMN